MKSSPKEPATVRLCDNPALTDSSTGVPSPIPGGTERGKGQTLKAGGAQLSDTEAIAVPIDNSMSRWLVTFSVSVHARRPLTGPLDLCDPGLTTGIVGDDQN
ncbi:hypothetical protein BaRGS_00014336 [Batillaria attramentaria]|uniref:Uncharacterized protein n=1 Tax=Batillaria attramentaria TaxID=370345 RepID=A0ABD0L4F1_9CAEN